MPWPVDNWGRATDSDCNILKSISVLSVLAYHELCVVSDARERILQRLDEFRFRGRLMEPVENSYLLIRRVLSSSLNTVHMNQTWFVFFAEIYENKTSSFK